MATTWLDSTHAPTMERLDTGIEKPASSTMRLSFCDTTKRRVRFSASW